MSIEAPLFFLDAVAAGPGLFLYQDSKMAIAWQEKLVRDAVMWFCVDKLNAHSDSE